MANFIPKIGVAANLPGIEQGSLLITSDEGKAYVDVSDSSRIAISNIFYGTCDTAAGTAAKVVNNVTGFHLNTGVMMAVKFSNNNTVANPTLNVNGTGAKALKQYGTMAIGTTSATNGWCAGAVVVFTYDGTYWVRDQAYNTNDRDPGYGKIKAGTASTSTAAITANTSTAEASTYNETLTINPGNKWIAVAASNSSTAGSDTFTIGHALSGATAGNYGDDNDQTPDYGSTFNVPYISIDAGGHITSISSHTVQIPASDNTDYQVRQSSSTTSSDYRVLLSYSANDTQEDNITYKSTNLTFNPGTAQLSVGGNISATGDLNITGTTSFSSESYINSLTAGALLVNGAANFVQIPTAPTPATSSNDTSIATTEFVKSAFSTNGAVIGPTSATSGHVAVFDGTTGKLIADGAYTIGTSVPSTAKFTDTTYTASTGLSLTSTSFYVSQANVSTMINLLSTGASAPKDADYYVAQYAGGGTSTTSYHRRPHSALYDYIKGKLGIDTSGTTFLRKDGTWITPTNTTYTFDGTYDASTNKAATVATVTSAINALTATITGTASTSATISAFSQTSGKVAVTFSPISIAPSQINDTIPNSGLTNSSISIAGTSVELGGSISADDLRTNLNLSQALKFVGITSAGVADGNNTIPTDLGITSYSPSVGDVVIDSDTNYEYVWVKGEGFLTGRWEKLGSDSSYKITQSTVSSATTASTTAATTFVSIISQNANGEISYTTKPVATATTATTGIVQLSTSTGSTSTALAATPSAVKAAYDLANTYKGTVTSIATGTGLAGGPITNSGTISLSDATTSTIGGVVLSNVAGSALTTGTASTGSSTAVARADHTHQLTQALVTGALGYTPPTTNTWNALSTSQAGYVAQAPNDTTKFLRGDANWAALPAASTSTAGIVQLSSATNSTSNTLAATPAAVKAAYDLANGKTSNTGTVTSIETGTGLTGGPITTSGTISLASGVITTTGTYGDTAQQTPSHGGTFNIPYITVDTYGRVTSAGITTVKLPTDNNTDVNVTQGLTTASSWRKIILSNTTAATSTANFSTTTGQVYASTAISVLPAEGKLRATIYNIADKVELQYNATTNALDFVFI